MGDDKGQKTFKDSVGFDPVARRVIAFRDGVYLYKGHELGLEPSNKVFKVYRSPATVATAAAQMGGLPVTDGHVDSSQPVDSQISAVESSGVVDLFDGAVESTLGVESTLTKTSALDSAVASGSRELSLCFFADLAPHSVHGLEHTNIRNHHLAVVPAGRAGPSCAFLDRRPESDEMDKDQGQETFKDADGNVSIEQLMATVTALPDVIRNLTPEQLGQISGPLMEIAQLANPSGPADGQDGQTAAADEGADENADGEKSEGSYSDEDVERIAAQRSSELVQSVLRATELLGHGFRVAGKNALQIQKEVLAKMRPGMSFSDSEAPVAFKMLEPPAANNPLKTFGEEKPGGKDNSFAALKDEAY